MGTAQLIGIYVFAYAKRRFSHNAAHIGSALLKGKAAERRLFKDLIPLGQQGKVRLYVKVGGAKQMKKDFHSMKPTQVRDHEVT